jgi:hypothetical protein
MAVIRRAVSACVVVVAMQGCAEPASDELQIESPDPIMSAESALELPDGLGITAISLCAQVSGTYDYAPWAREFVGSARCVKQTTTVPAMGFGTDHETTASFPEFTGLNIAPVGQETPAQKCKKAGIRVTVKWLADGTTWNYEVKAVPKYGPVLSASEGFALSPNTSRALSPNDLAISALTISRVTSCVAKHTSGLSGHGPSDFTITTTPFTGQTGVVLLPAFRPMTSRVEAIF